MGYFDRADRPEELSKKKTDFFKDYHTSLAVMINCKAWFHRSHNTTQWMMRSLWGGDSWYERSFRPFLILSIWQTKLVSAYFLKTGILCCQKFAPNSKGCQNVAEQLVTEATHDSKKVFSFTCGWTKLKRGFFLLTPFMCKGEDLDDSNTLRTGRVFYLKAKKKSLF